VSGFHLAHPWALALLALLPVVAWLFVYGDRRRRAALARFSGAPALTNPVDPRKRRRKRICVLAAMALTIGALARPVWLGGAASAEPKTSDVVFLLDVSRSMLAGDAQPTRLDHAKSIIESLVRQFRTERAALVVFSGNAAVQCPLTIDYNYFRERLDAADNDSATRGGTRIGEAIKFTLTTAFDDVVRGHKQLVLLTDGGDQDNSTGEAAQLATQRRVRIIAVGIGNDQVGAVVPVSATDPSPFLYQGKPVQTRLESAGLETLANMNLGGLYLNAGMGAIDATQLYRQMLAAESPVPASARNQVDGYPLLLALAIALLVVESMAGERRVQAAVVCLLFAVTLRADDTDSVPKLVQTGNEFFGKGNYTTAQHFYLMASGTAPNSPEVMFDLGLAFYRSEFYDESVLAYERAAALSRDEKFRAQCKFGHANAAYRIAMKHQKNIYDFQQALALTIGIYREALKLDPSLVDAKYNIEVIKRKLRELESPMRANMNKYMVQSRQDVARSKNTEASDILNEERNGKKSRGQIGRPKVDTDW